MDEWLGSGDEFEGKVTPADGAEAEVDANTAVDVDPGMVEGPPMRFEAPLSFKDGGGRVKSNELWEN